MRETAAACGYQVRVASQATHLDMLKALWGEGVVVFDATIESSDQHNYRVASYSLLHSPYSIILSRSYLPMNFRGHLEPIAPPYPEHWGRAELIEKLRQRLHDLIPLLPKPPGSRSMKGMESLIDSAQAPVRQKIKDAFSVFLSYRGTHMEAAQSLVDRSLQEHGKRIRIVRTDDISYSDEILSLQRRWQVLRQIYTSLSAAHEFWVLWSDDYLASWWTQGEVVSFANMTGEEKPIPRILGLRETDKVPSPAALIPRLTRRQQRTMFKRFLLCNLPESLVRIRKLAGNRMARTLLGLRGDAMLEPSFNDDPLLECVGCARHKPPIRNLNVESFLSGGLLPLQALSRPALTLARETGVLHCPACQAAYRVTGGPPRYWWYPTRGERGTGPEGKVLEERPLYRARLEQ
jgi:hypothetical protein